MIKDIYVNYEEKMKKAIEALRRELSSLRTGRATPALLEMTVRSFTPLARISGIRLSGLPERPKPPDTSLRFRPRIPMQVSFLQRTVFVMPFMRGLKPRLRLSVTFS